MLTTTRRTDPICVVCFILETITVVDFSSAPAGKTVTHSTRPGPATGCKAANPTAPANNPTPNPIHPKLFMTTPQRNVPAPLDKAHPSPNQKPLKTNYLRAFQKGKTDH